MSLPVFQPGAEIPVGRLLRLLAAERGDAEALVYPGFALGGTGLRLTYAALDAYVDTLAKGLIAAGIGPDDHVALWASNVPDWVPLEFALARIGAVLVTVNTALQADEVGYVLRQSGAVAVVHASTNGNTPSSAILDRLLEQPDNPLAAIRTRVWLPAFPDEAPPVGVLPGPGGPTRGPLPSLARLVAGDEQVTDAQLAAREQAVAPEDVVNIQYTSGTTGFPKGVMLSHVNLLSTAFALGDELRTTQDDRVALIVPLFHCFGCVVAVLGTFTFGATLCAIPSFDPVAALKLFEAERCTIVHGVPTMFSAMLAAPELETTDTSSLRTGLVAGAPAPPPLMRAIADKLRCEGILVAYGLTEASPGVAGCNPEDPLEDRCATIGRPLPGVDVRLVDPVHEHEVADGEQGEIQVRGRNVMVGYHDDPRATAETITGDGWLRTGDLGQRGPDGLLRVVGRLKDIIIRGGENIAPTEIENVLREHPDIVDAAVVGVPDEHFGEELAAAVVLQDGTRLDVDSYRALLEPRVAAFKVPRLWRALERLPLTGSGKVQKYRLREMFAEG